MQQTLKSHILSTLRGEKPAGVPWNCYGWLLPKTEAAARFCAQGLSRMEYETLIRVRHHDMDVRETTYIQDGTPHFHVEVETPYGVLTEDARLDSSYGSRWITKFLFTGPQDFPAARYFLEHTTYEPRYDAWIEADRRLGEGGFVTGEIMPIPVMKLIVSWMGVEGFLGALVDDPAGTEEILAILDRHYDRQIDIAAAGPAEIIWFGDNVTATIISPRLYDRFCVPVYRRVMPVMRAAGKIPISHYDGSNRPLVKAIAQTDLPVIEAFTPPPMGDLTLSEGLAAWPEKVIGVNFPGFLFVEPYDKIKQYALDLLREGGSSGRFFLGCTEDFPMDQFEKTFGAIQAAYVEYEGEGG